MACYCALAVLLTAWAACAAENASQGLHISNNSSLDVAFRQVAVAAVRNSTATAATAPEMGRHPANASTAIASTANASAAEASAVEATELLRPAATNAAHESIKQDLNVSKESSSHETIVASVSADGMISEEAVGDGDSSDDYAEDDDYELVAEYDEDELNDDIDTTEPVEVKAPSGRKRSSMVRSERLSPGDISPGFPSALADDTDAGENSTMSEVTTEAKSMSLLRDFRTLFVLLFLLCLPMVAILVVANWCMGLDVHKPSPLIASKFPHPAGLDAVRRRPNW